MKNNFYSRLPYIGFLCLGGFIGGVLNYGIQYIDSLDDFLKSINLIVGTAIAGSVLLFLQFLSKEKFVKEDKNAIYAYPLGLLLALLWLQARKGLMQLPEFYNKLFIGLHILLIFFVISYIAYKLLVVNDKNSEE